VKEIGRFDIAVIAIAAVMILAPSIGLVTVAKAQPPLRIGASMSQTGSLAAPGQNMLRGYQLCVKHANEKGGVLQIAQKNVLFQWQDGRKVIVWPTDLAPGKPRFPTPPWSQRQ